MRYGFCRMLQPSLILLFFLFILPYDSVCGCMPCVCRLLFWVRWCGYNELDLNPLHEQQRLLCYYWAVTPQHLMSAPSPTGIENSTRKLCYHNHGSYKTRNCAELTHLYVKWNPGNVGRMGGHRPQPLPAKESPQIIRSWNWCCCDRGEIKK